MLSPVFYWHTHRELRPIWEDSWRASPSPMPRDAGSALSLRPQSTPPAAASRSLQREELSYTFTPRAATPPDDVERTSAPVTPSPSPPRPPLPELQEEAIEPHVLDSSLVMESEPDLEPPRKRRRLSRDDETGDLEFSDRSGEVEESEEHVSPSLGKRTSSRRAPFLDPLDIAERRGQRYRNVSGPGLDAATLEAARAIVGNVRLGTSKSPILDALVYCALKGWGCRLVRNEGDEISLLVDDFQKYYQCSAVICSKEHPTEDQAARIKALRRWFPDFPAKQDTPIVGNSPFVVHVQRPAAKDNKPKKLRDIIQRMSLLVASEGQHGGLKRSRDD